MVAHIYVETGHQIAQVFSQVLKLAFLECLNRWLLSPTKTDVSVLVNLTALIITNSTKPCNKI